MQHRRRLLVAGALALLALAGPLLAPALLPPAPGVTWENFERIHEGMTEGEVEALLGSPGKASPCSPGERLPKGSVQKEWQGEFTWVFVVFDRDGAVVAKGPSFVESGAWMERHRPGIVSRLRDLLPW